MAENPIGNTVLGDSEAVENEDQSLDHVPVTQIPVEEESNLLEHSEYSVDAPGWVSERIGVAQISDSVNQESSSMQEEYVDLDDGVLVSRPGSEEFDSEDGKVVEDSGKDDMFVDAPDELSGYDGRNTDSGKPSTSNENQDQESLEGKDEMRETRLHELDDKRQVHHLIDEVERLRAMLEKEVAEKEVFAQENKEERENFTNEIANCWHQLNALTDQQSLIGENDVAKTPLHEMMNRFSESLKSALEEQLRTEGTMRELHATLCMKDKEIEDLNAKVTELSLSRDVVETYVNSSCSQSMEVPSEAQLKNEQHIEDAINRMLASFSMVINQNELSDDSVAGKIFHVEKSASLLMENYNQFLSEIDQLRQCLTEAGSDQRVQEEFGAVFVSARDELLELRRKQADFIEKVSHLEGENTVLVEQLNKEKGMVESLNAELGKMKIDLEQEKARFANTKEKLSMAVTKGKALVQQRDSLRQLLVEKSSELEKCLVELQEKSSALEAAESFKEELVKSENLAASLQDALSQRDMALEHFELLLSQSSIPEGLQSMDLTEKIRWLVDEKNALKDASLELHKVKDVLSSIDLSETVLSSDLATQVNWLGESFYHAKDEIIKLQDSIGSMKETANNEIGHLSASLSAELQEKSYLQVEMDDLTCKYEVIVHKEHQLSLEKDQVVNMLLEASGITLDDQEDVSQYSADMPMLIDRCLGKMKEQNNISDGASHVEAEKFEGILTLLYVRDQELMLCQDILEEDVLERSTVNNLLNELKVASQELSALNHEKDSLLKNLERSEEKCTLVREKLSMAVKKGKGLVQDRENLKGLLDEKNKEIEKLKLELQQQESTLGDYKDQISRLSTDVECIPKLEMDLVGLNEQRDQLEKFLVESNNMLQRVIECLDGIVLPGDIFLEAPVEKVKWIAGYFNECQAAKAHAEQELGMIRDEASSLATKLEEAHTTIKSMEETLSVAENDTSLLAEEKLQLEVGKVYFEQELQKAIEEAHNQTSRFAEACAAKKSLEDALTLAENNISVLINEKEDANIGRAAAEVKLEKVNEEVASQTSKLADAYKAIETLEGALSQVESEAALLSEENNSAQVGRTDLETELKKLKDEVSFQAGNLAEANTTIKSLEDALLKAENNVSELGHGKEVAEGEILALNSKLNACLEELSGTHGSFESRSVELIGHIKDLQGVMNDETLLSLLRKSFEKQFEKLKEMNIILKAIRVHLVEMDSGVQQNLPIYEEDSYGTKHFTDSLDNILNIEMDYGEMNAVDGDSISSQFKRTLQGLHLRSKFLTDKFEDLYSSMDEYTAALLGKFQATREDFVLVLEQMGSLKQEVKNMEMYKQTQEDTIAALENDVRNLESACTDATKELQFAIENKLVESSSVSELELEHSLYSEVREVGVDASAGGQQRAEGGKFVQTAEKLLLATRKVQTLFKHIENTRNVSVATMEDMQNNLKEARNSFEKAMEERDQGQNRVYKLETDVEGLQNLCSELRCEVEDLQAKEDKLKEREAEVSSLYNTLLRKEQEREKPLLSSSQVRTIFERISDIELPFEESEVGDLEPHSSPHVKKLFCVINNITGLQHQMMLLSQDKEELQSTLATQILEIEHLKEEVEKQSGNMQDLERMKSDLSELTLGLEKIILKLGGNDVVGEQNPAGGRELLPVVQKLVTSLILESENLKTKTQELSAKLHGSQKVVDELSNKVTSLEDSVQIRTVPSPEIVQERSIFEAPSLPTSSEISEIEDVGPVGKKVVSPPPPSAAQMRTLRKGSTDHISLDVDLESDRLIKTEDTDGDKGHAFKSLNTSGLIPIQGKMIADRVDGIWVSGGRVLMSRPRARLGLIAYWLLLHIWLLGTIL